MRTNQRGLDRLWSPAVLAVLFAMVLSAVIATIYTVQRAEAATGTITFGSSTEDSGSRLEQEAFPLGSESWTPGEIAGFSELDEVRFRFAVTVDSDVSPDPVTTSGSVGVTFDRMHKGLPFWEDFFVLETGGGIVGFDGPTASADGTAWVVTLHYEFTGVADGHTETTRFRLKLSETASDKTGVAQVRMSSADPAGTFSSSGLGAKTVNIQVNQITPIAILTVVKDLTPVGSGTFDLLIDGAVVADDVGDGGSSGRIAVATDAVHTVSETFGDGSAVAGFTSGISCTDGGGGGSVVAAASGVTSLVLPAELAVNAADIVCTITNSEVIADLSIAKSDDVDPIVAGGTLTYTVTVTNAGPSDAVNVVVTDTLPAGVTFVSTSGCTEDPSGVPTCSLGGIANGASANYTITVSVDATTVGTITNTASVTSDTSDDDATDNTTTEDTLVVAPSADLSLTKDVDNATPLVGQNVVFTIAVTNGGPDAASGVTVADQLPSGYSYVSDDGSGAYVSGTGVWTIGALAVSQSATLEITATVLESGAYTNSAEVATATEADPDSTPGNNVPSEDDQDTATTTPSTPPADPVADLSLTKDVDNATPLVGQNVVFTIAVTNGGPDAASGVTVADQLPSGYSYVSDDGSGAYVSGTGVWTIGALAVSQSATLEITATVLESGAYTNSAEVATATEADPDSTPGNNVPSEDDQDTATTTPSTPPADPVADLSLTKDVDNATPLVGQNVVFTIAVTNGGPDAASGVTVADQLPSGYSYVSDDGSGAYVSGTGVWTIGALAVSQSATLEITATVLESGAYTNSAEVATATEADPDSTPGNNVPSEDDHVC